MIKDSTFTADRGDAGRRIDLVVRRHLGGAPDATRTRVQGWIAGGRITVNGASVRRAAARVACGDVVTLQWRDGDRAPSKCEVAAEEVPLDVLYEDDHFLALNKPPGLVAHPTYRHPGGTLMNALRWRALGWTEGQRPSLVGRLDRLTSGLVIAARTRGAHAALQRALARSDSEKDYLAVVYGRVRTSQGRIDLPLGRDPCDRRRVVAAAGSGRPSTTRFEVLARAAAPAAGLALLRCRLVTGRMHQIRVHLAARGWPIVGDPLYGEPRWTRIADASLAAHLSAFPRQALHAWRVAVRHPATGRRIEIEAPLPEDFRTLVGRTFRSGVSGGPEGPPYDCARILATSASRPACISSAAAWCIRPWPGSTHSKR